MALMSKPTHDPKLTRWWWRTLREWVYELIDPLWGAFRGENSDEIALANLTDINGVSASELGVLDGLTATTAELNKLSGLTSDASELNKADRTQADGVAEASRNMVLDANKDILGKRYDINQSLLEAIANRPYIQFDGVDDKVEKDTTAIPIDYPFALEARFRTTATATGALVFIGDKDSGDRYAWIGLNASGQAIMEVRKSGEGGVVGTSTAAYNDGEWHHAIGVFRSATDRELFVDGVSAATSTTPVVLSAGNDRVSIGVVGDLTPGAYFKGGIVLPRIWNRTPTADEVKALSSGSPPDFADLGANQTDLVTNGEDWTGASGSTPPNNWSDTGSGTGIYIIRDNTPVENFGDNKTLEFSASGGSKTLYQGVAQAGKRFRVSFVYRNLDGSSSSYVALGSSTNKATLQNTGISGDGILFEQDFMADGTDLMFFVDTDGTLQIDHVQVIQIGCVAAYQPAGITHAQWQDDSGNELHGSVSGAVPLNLPSNHVARYIKQGITGDTTLTDAVPAGYRIKSMVADVTGAGAGMRLNVGTSAGGTDVVNNQDISSNGLFDLTVGKHIFNLSSAQSLFVNDDGGTTWSGVSVDLYIEMERVK